ncbi:MAG: tRNA (guanosine(37)-N1)-methyltransferase TrmD [Deltaproteobacteria bacterium]|nr:tRNA (guanosine(37)-N1)-methyltransferase TrmD [Deltaproteobacteria bacterium]
MQVQIVTLFPELFGQFLATSMVARAVATGALVVHLEQLRDHGIGRHRSVDDTPYGGGAGMVLRVDVVAQAIEAAEARTGGRSHRVLLTPQGRPLRQSVAHELAARPSVTLVCGRYEGFDERVRALVDEELSLGDFVLAGGEVPAMAVVEACIRLLPGVLGNGDSAREESFADGDAPLLEYPQFTRPAEFRGSGVPEVLLSGDHARIAEYRRREAEARTLARRPELLAGRGTR